jgi:hypothetical protein
MTLYISNIARSPGDPKVLHPGPSSLGSADRMAKALGWFSIALGVAELAAPHRFTKALGMEGKEGLVRAYGLREIGHGIVSLGPDRHLGLWSRVAGDMLDIATLLPAVHADNPKSHNAKIALAMVAAVTALDVIGAQSVAARHSRHNGSRRSYRDRSGFPQGIQAARGAARDFVAPPDMREAPALASISDRPAERRGKDAAQGGSPKPEAEPKPGRHLPKAESSAPTGISE